MAVSSTLSKCLANQNVNQLIANKPAMIQVNAQIMRKQQSVDCPSNDTFMKSVYASGQLYEP